MTRWLPWLAVVLVVIAVGLALAARAGWIDRLPFGWQGPRPEGPPVPGARGRLAYARDGDLFTYDLRAGLERRLTETGGVSSPRWAGGGGWLSFIRDGKLWVVRPDGVNPQAVPDADLPANATWSPRGARLAFPSQDGSLSTFDPSARGGTRRIIVPPGSGVGPTLAWSGDGGRVAYERHQPASARISNEGIWSVTAAGRDPTPVYLASGDYHLALCCWSYTGTYMLFWEGTHSTLQAAPASPSAPAAPTTPAATSLPLYISRSGSSQPVLVAEATPLRRANFDSAPRSDALAIVAGEGPEATAGLRLLGIEARVARGTNVVVDTIIIEGDPALAPSSPAWAPGGAFPNPSLAYSVGPSLSARNGDLAASLANRRIWIARADGSTKHALLPDATIPTGVSDDAPAWARDGKTLVFVRRLNPEAAARAAGGAPAGVELWVATADGGAARRVAGGLPDPGPGDRGAITWNTLFDYYRG